MTVWQAKRKTMQHYDSTASSYDALYADEQNRQIEAALKHVRLKEESRVIDVGCGTGLLFSRIDNKINFAVGIDISRKLLLQAKKRAKQTDPQVALLLADADHMPFKDKAFNTAFAMTLLQNMPHENATLKEIKRILEPNSLVAVTGLKKKYTLEDFAAVLKKAGLRILASENEETLKGHVAICQR